MTRLVASLGIIYLLKLVLVFAVVFSLASFSGAISSDDFQLPAVHLARASPAPCTTTGSPCSESWVPAGPAMDTFMATIFTDESAEFQNIQSASPSIDLTDWPLTPDLLTPFTTQSQFYITSTISEHAYYEAQFMLGAGNFWGCNMNFGNSQCGIAIRQGISHLIDKTKFTSTEPSIKGISSPIDNPLQTSNGGLPSPNPCLWDNGVVPSALANTFSTAPVPGTMHGAANCVVGSPGGAAYHLASASGVISPWQPSVSDLDFCAAAAHFIDAGLASGVVADSASPATRNCTLTGLSSAVTSGGITFFIRSDSIPRLHFGDSLAQAICAVFTGSYTTSCGTDSQNINILRIPPGPISAFTGFTTSTDHVDVSWHMYTAFFSNSFPFDKSLYYTYNSRFVSGISSIHTANGGTCSNDSVPTTSAADYMYVCNANYDNVSKQIEFANCLTAQAGTDPTNGQTTPTFGTCNAGGSSSVSAGYQAEDAFGKAAYTLPVFQQVNQFGYLSHTPGNPSATWSKVINHFGNGIPNTFTWLDAWNPSPASPGVIRQGFRESTRSVSPYIASDPWDLYIVRGVYDSLHIVNPLNNTEDLSWMDIAALNQTSLTYAPPTGTVWTYRFILMPNLSWQDGRPVTSFDVAFSYLSLLANAAPVSGGVSVLSGVTILGPTQFDLNVRPVGPFTRLMLTSVPILPGRYWTCGTGTQPSTGTVPNIAPAPCSSAGPSQWDAGMTTCANAGNACYPVQYTLGTAPAQTACYPNAAASCAPPAVAALNGASSFVANLMNADATKTGALYDPIKDHIFVGSGAWACGTGAGLGQNCTPGGIMNPGVGQSYTLQRNGKGVTPGFPGDYFRGSCFLATWLWSGDILVGVGNFSAAKQCFGVTPLEPLSASPPVMYGACGHWQQGIGTNGATTPAGTGGCPTGTTPCGIPVGSNQLSIVKLYINISCVFNYYLSYTTPFGMVALDPVLYAGSAGTLSPATGTGSVGCASPYPIGGYDC